MPLISKFYGIDIKMYFSDDEQHHTPHFHAKYGEYEASFDLTGKLIKGSFPIRQEKYVAVWADIHTDELNLLWKNVQEEGKSFKIKGLK